MGLPADNSGFASREIESTKTFVQASPNWRGIPQASCMHGPGGEGHACASTQATGFKAR